MGFPLVPFILSLFVAIAFFTVVFLIAMHRNDNSIVDLAWSPAFILLALWSFIQYGFPTELQILTTTLVVIWGCRLYLHLWLRKRGQPEDFRYASWRKKWGKRFVLRSYTHIYLFQAVLLAIIALPVLLVNYRPIAGLTWIALVGTIVWVEGFFWEAVADWQLARFKADKRNKGKIMTKGLWRYSRHPNYFGELLQWWGIGLLALSVRGGWIGLISPLLLTILLTRVSGIPLLEKKWAEHKEYQAYAKRTSMLLPGRPGPEPKRRKA